MEKSLRTLGLLIVVLALVVPTSASAFCGFFVGGGDAQLFNDATQVVLMRDGTTTVLSMQNKYEGPLADFAMVVPVPQILEETNVKTLKKEAFDKVDKLSAPRLVEYWEQNPCGVSPGEGFIGNLASGGLGMKGFGRGGGGRGYVKVRSEFEVGEYEIAILETNSATSLDEWLKGNNYKIPADAAPYFKPYIESGQYFFVAKVNAKKVRYEEGKAVLSPLRFHYQSDEFSLPIRLGMINSKGEQDLLVYVLSPQQRYEVANYPNVTIPTNVEVGPKVKKHFGEFYEALLSRTFEENPQAVVTEYSWAAQKCDPCPSGIIGGAAMSPQDLQTLGNDVINFATSWGGTGWVLTRLHARYAKDGVGEDLVFKKAGPIVGGREHRSTDGSLEKGALEGASNNFQGRYIIRNEWEGEVTCEEPQRGRWGGPPNAYEMTMIADVIVAEVRRAKAAKEGREPSAEDLAAPWTDEETKAVGFHLRKKFGTSLPPGSATGAALAAPSANTRGAGAGLLKADFSLGSVIKEPIPELKLTPAPEPPKEARAAKSPTEEPATKIEPKGPPKSGCSSTEGSASWLALFVGMVFLGRRRIRVRRSER